MGTLSFLTKEQQNIFSEVGKSDYLRERFYFTGGTALSAIYLHHRYSDDLDFFSEQQIDTSIIFPLLTVWSKKYNFKIQTRYAEVVYVCNFLFPNNTTLKVDFGYYPRKRVTESKTIDSVEIDSLEDIAINKVVTVSQRNNVKDFVDLYFLLQTFGIWDLIAGAESKFKMKIEPFLLATDFLKVEHFTTLPQMIKPLSIEELQAFYRQKAKDLAGTAIK